MIPYAPLNGVSPSWCSLTERLIKRHDLWLIKAEPVIKEIDFNLQGERGEEKRQAGEISAEGTVGIPWFAMQGHGAFYGVSLWQHMRQTEPGPAPKPLQGSFPRATRQTQGLFSSLGTRETNISALICFCIWHYLPFWGTVLQLKSYEGVASLGGFFHLGWKRKSEMQTTLEAHTWNCEMHHPWEMGLGHPQAPNSLQRKDGSSPAFSTTAQKVGSKGDFYWSKLSFHICRHFCRAWQASSSLPGKNFQHTLSQDPLFPTHTLKSHQGKQVIRLQD